MYGWSQADKLIKLSTFFLDDRRYRLTIDVEPTFDGVMITAAGTYRSADLLPRINAEFGAALETRVDCDVIDGQRVYRRA
jgi:hypothetical protein